PADEEHARRRPRGSHGRGTRDHPPAPLGREHDDGREGELRPVEEEAQERAGTRLAPRAQRDQHEREDGHGEQRVAPGHQPFEDRVEGERQDEGVRRVASGERRAAGHDPERRREGSETRACPQEEGRSLRDECPRHVEERNEGRRGEEAHPGEPLHPECRPPVRLLQRDVVEVGAASVEHDPRARAHGEQVDADDVTEGVDQSPVSQDAERVDGGEDPDHHHGVGSSSGQRQPARGALTRAGTAVHKAGPMRALLVTLGHLLASGRGRYGVLLAAAIGAAMWVVWLISVLARPGLLDLAGNVKGTDFLEFYAAGRIVAAHQTDHLYDLDVQARVEHEITAPEQWSGFHGFITPPFFALPFVPLAALPYLSAFALWSALGILMVMGTLWLVDRVRAAPWVLAFIPVWAAISYGQNSLLSVFILASVYVLLRRGRDGVAAHSPLLARRARRRAPPATALRRRHARPMVRHRHLGHRAGEPPRAPLRSVAPRSSGPARALRNAGRSRVARRHRGRLGRND